jgi:membrane-associated phospholipid phosphatase
VGPVGMAVLGALAVVVAVATWVAWHPVRVRTTLARWRRQPPVDRLAGAVGRAGLPPVVTRRFAPGQVAGLALTVGLALVLVVTALFAFVLDDVLEGRGIAAVDRPAVWWLAGHREAWLTAPLTMLSTVGGPLGAGVLAAVVATAVAAARRSWLPLLLGLLGAGGLSLVTSTVKAAVGRPRPPLPVAAVSEHGFSFPSGHATGAAGVVGLSAWMLTRWVVRRWRARVAVWTAAILLVGGIGLSRVYLGVHYPSDVIGGWTVGTAWAAAVGVGGAWWERAARMRARIAGWVTAPEARTDEPAQR